MTDPMEVLYYGEDREIPCVYIAGPMRGYSEFNFPAFDEATTRYYNMGYCVHSPAEHDRDEGFNERGLTGNEDLAELGFDIKAAIMWDLKQVAFCDKIVLLEGWLKSSGAQLELNLAQFLGKEVIFD